MKNLSFFGQHVMVLSFLLGTITTLPTLAHSVPVHATTPISDKLPSDNPRITIEVANTPIKINHPATSGRSLAHRTSQTGYPSLADSGKTKRCLSDSEFVLFPNQEYDGSSRCPGLDLFGTFWGDVKKYSKPNVTPSVSRQTQNQVSGVVSDAKGPLPSVTITLKGTTTTTISDQSGHYTITTAPGDTLIFSFIGYKTLELPITGTTLNAVLTEDATSLQEVTVNAGYYTVKEKERTGSIAKIKAADIELQPVANPLAAMQGRMSGVNITQATGVAGGGFDIQIRGRNSIRIDGSDPLYLVDGVPFGSAALGDPAIGSAGIFGLTNPLNIINPADIESIEVLKDADATAIYGSRGANGVVLITTKKGRAGATRFNVQAFTTVGEVARRMDLMDTQQFITMREQAFENDGITEYPANAYDLNGTWDRDRYTDWQEKLIGGTSYINNVQASASGGSLATQYLLSGTWRNETSVFPGEGKYTKGVVHTSVTHRTPDERFALDFTGSYATDRNTLPGVDLTRLAYTLAPNAPELYDEDGELNWQEGSFNNPLAFLEGGYGTRMQNLVANTLLSYRISNGLAFRTSLGYNDTRHAETATSLKSRSNPFSPIIAEASIRIGQNVRKSWIVEPQLDWNTSWSKAKINVLAGATFQNLTSEALAIYGSGFSSDALVDNLGAASILDILNHNVTDYRYNAVFARANVNWAGRYIINLTGRRDGSSRFGPDNRFANFGAAGAAWLFSEEPLLKKDGSILSFGKLRGSYGVTGNDQIGDYQYLDTYGISPYNYGGVIGLQPTRLYNPDFGWETNHKLEAALELGLLKDRIYLTAAWFRNRSSSQLVGVPLPGTTGFPSLLANFDATVQNTGLEFDLRTANFRGKDFNWTTTLNVSIPDNELLEFPNLEGSTYANQLVIGEPLTIRKVYEYTGIDADTGVYTFTDVNGDGELSADDRQTIIDLSPNFFGGISNQVSYKRFSFDFLFQFVKQMGQNYLLASPMAGTLNNQPAGAIDAWPQQDAQIQVYSTGANSAVSAAYNNFTNSSGAYGDASFVRLKNVSLAYSLSSLIGKSLSGKVYLQGQNLLTFTKYKGADPESQSSLRLPPLKLVTLGVQLNF